MRKKLEPIQRAARRMILLLLALLAVAIFRVALWLLPLRSVLRAPLLLRVRQPTGDAERIVWAVMLAARAVPAASCLVQALAAQALLAACGYASELRFGVVRGPQGTLEAHAWLEQHGRVVIGQLADLARYRSLPLLAPHL